MELIWIPISVLGALLQAVRTAGQKALNAELSTLVTTYVRSFFGLPLLLVYLWFVKEWTGQPFPDVNTRFLIAAFGAAFSQVMATVFLIQMFTLRNFAVGTTMTKTDVMMTAIIGSLFFSEAITGLGWVAVILTVTGVFLMTFARAGVRAFLVQGEGMDAWKPTLIGLAAALGFTFSYLFVREASLSLENGDVMMRAACSVVTVITIQVVFFGAYLLWREPEGLKAMFPNWKLCTFIGVTSAVGSICWFTAFALENASYVRSVGQVEAIFTLLISLFYFKERFNTAELTGIAVTVAGVLLFLL
ncbi:MAG: DMT family transporter [Hyphomicrobiaceae bacterium]|nr:DMT family transporter [Hyphomicrobiaceae bacterium]